jgi:hypothetical protein
MVLSASQFLQTSTVIMGIIVIAASPMPSIF